MKRITYYDILGISKTATIEQIKEAYHKKAKEVHPDLNNKLKGANAKMVWINKAFQTLSDPVKRLEYDLKLENLNYAAGQKTSYQNTQNSDTNQNTNSNYSYNYQNQNAHAYQAPQPPVKKKSNKWRTAFIVLLVIVIYSVVTQQNTGSANGSRNNNVANNIPSQIISPTETPYPSYPQEQTYQPNYYVAPTEPQIDCTGPDGKHFQTTQQQCNAFNAAWAPTPTPIPDSYYGF